MLTYAAAPLGSSNLQVETVRRTPAVACGEYVNPLEQLAVSNGGMFPGHWRWPWVPETPWEWALRTSMEPDNERVARLSDPLSLVEELWAHHADGSRLTLNELRQRNARIDAAYASSLRQPTPDLMRTLAQAEKEINVSIETPVAPSIASRVGDYMRTCPDKVRPSDVAAALGLTSEQVGHNLNRLAIAGDLKAEGKTVARRYWNPNALTETPVEPDPAPAAAPAPEDVVADAVAEDHEETIAAAAGVLTHKLLTLDTGRDAIKMQIATLEAELAQSNSARARLVQALDGLENLDKPVLAAA